MRELKGRSLKRLQKRAKRGMRGWPAATICFYGPNASQATKVVVGIVPSEYEEVGELRDWKVENGDVRTNVAIADEMLAFMERHGVLSVAMSDGIMGCPHQEGIDYEGQGAPIPRARSGTDAIALRGSA